MHILLEISVNATQCQEFTSWHLFPSEKAISRLVVEITPLSSNLI